MIILWKILEKAISKERRISGGLPAEIPKRISRKKRSGGGIIGEKKMKNIWSNHYRNLRRTPGRSPREIPEGTPGNIPGKIRAEIPGGIAARISDAISPRISKEYPVGNLEEILRRIYGGMLSETLFHFSCSKQAGKIGSRQNWGLKKSSHRV